MKGWKTWASAGLAAALGIIAGLEAGGVLPDGSKGIALAIVGPIAAALGLVGIGHKLEKSKEG
ncbi:MAG: hypothetical protein ACXACT_16850 [Candidatus Thorarchaeota archaeon]|jgi:hypothetical protein